ncbi:MAG: sporulation inhibitor of replication protein SirA [Bacilli bacterium]|nr:sporulation inhibitor of replication protein SirA [Bacilli bacterium]
MRTFYIFSINKILSPIYENKSGNIYNMLNKVRNYNKKELVFAKKIYLKIINPIDKKKIDNYLLMNYMNNFYYTKMNNIHKLKSDKEYSKLTIHNTYIKIVTNNNISSFFKDFYNINKNYFIIDFDNKDYFYLEDLRLKLLV